MRKVLSLLAPVTLALVACNTDLPPVQNFTGSGKVQNFVPKQDYPLTVLADAGAVQVGMLKTDKTIELNLSSDIAQQRSRLLSDYVALVKAGGCDVSRMEVQDTRYRNFSRFDFNVGDVKSYVTTQSETRNADGSITTNQKMFWYATAAGSLKGVISCPGTTPAMYDVQLQAGWNIVNYVETVKPTTKTLERVSFGPAVSGNRYDGPWSAYSSN